MSLKSSLDLIQEKHIVTNVVTNSFRNSKNRSNRYQKDFYNICFLMFLYLLQGVPIGLLYSLPFILSSRNTSYADQGTFSFAGWPYSMKLLWAPVVDSVFSRRIGRRKSWLVPVQYMIGACMLIFSRYVHTTLETEDKDIHDGEKLVL